VTRSPVWATALLAVLSCCSMLVPLVLLVAARVRAAPLFGEAPGGAAQHAADGYVETALVVAVAGTLAALGVAWRWRRTAVRPFAALTAVVAVVAVAFVVAHVARSGPRPVPGEPPHCQERSGGGTECPGG
jgi:hypothetical protein